jgi:hypothetical protein
MTTRPGNTKEQVLTAFKRVLERQSALASKLVTKEEQAEQANNLEVVRAASGYTIENIVKGLAELQLSFGGAIDNLTKRLGEDAVKLEELQRALSVETNRFQHLTEIRTAADALNILKQEYSDDLYQFEAQAKQRTEALDAEQAQIRGRWAEEAKEHEAAIKKFDETLAATRTKAENDFNYQLTRTRKIDEDAFEEKKLLALRANTEDDGRRNADWTAREAALVLRVAEFNAHKKKVDEFSQELDEQVKKAREESLKDTFADAKIKAELLEKEVEANRKVSALQIQSLESTLVKQAEQLEAITGQLQAATKQTQELAHKAIEGTSRRPSA